MSRIRSYLFILCLSLIPFACESPTATTSSEELTFTISPSPAAAAASTGVTYTIDGGDDPDTIVTYPWKTSFNVNMKEGAGVGRTITGMTVRVQQATGGIIITPTNGEVEHYQFTSQASGNRIEGNGTADVAFTVWYDLPNDGQEALVTVSFSFTDDDDYSFGETTTLQVR